MGGPVFVSTPDLLVDVPEGTWLPVVIGAPWFEVGLIPTTLAHTTLGSRAVGDTVNLEVDVVAKYVERLTVGYVPGARASDQDAAHREAGPVSSGDDAAEQQAVGS